MKFYILSKRGDIFYSDTDSIVTNIKLPDYIVSSSELGKLKLQHIVKKGIFITKKTYCIINDDNILINKAKGLKSDSLNILDYEKLLNNQNINTAIKSEYKINSVKGEVRILDKKIL